MAFGPRRLAGLGIALLLIGGMVGRPRAAGATIHVDDDTCPAPGDGSPASPYCRIQDAICAASPGDTVNVAPGYYTEAVRMKPGVSLVGAGGAAVTTIDAAGRPCTDGDFCAKRAGSQCSVVTFASGHTPSTVLEGFTLTGGAGLVQTNHVAGGGVFVFSSPTIANNVITGNELSGPRRHLKGAGVYVAVGAPVITGNTIEGNRAVPGPGAIYQLTYGYGGGIWVNFNTSPVITHNIIRGNQAGNPSVAYSLGAGGGIVAFPGDPNQPGPRIDGNLIAGNSTDTLGGGVSLNSIDGTGALAVVTNNVIVGNTAKNGGGVYTYFNKSATVNNTIADNFAFLGGGLYTGQSDPSLPVVITSNVIAGNRIDPFGDGGGIYTLDLSASFDPLIGFNDLWGNQRNQVAGDKSDSIVLGITGNFSENPLFVNVGAGDYHLDPYSPAIDRGDAAAAPPVDRDGTPRGQDGDGTPDFPVAGDVDVGAYEVSQSCRLDSDADTLSNCVDPDDDNDGTPDPSDCAPLDAALSSFPGEVLDLQVAGSLPALVTFGAAGIAGPVRYEVLVGLIGRLRAVGGYGDLFCGASSAPAAGWTDTRDNPPPGDGWYYLVRAVNGCGEGTLGSPNADAAGAGDACDTGVVDLDADGAPSDVDCDDLDPAVTPFADTDRDGLNDCADPDDDGDGVVDAGDCAPRSAGVWGIPQEVQDLDVQPAGPTQLIWPVQSLGPETRYEVAAGVLVSTGALDFAAGGCAGPAIAAPPFQDGRPDPPAGGAWYYLVKARNLCGAGTYGTPARDALPLCP